MAWVRVDDEFYDSEKWDGAPADSVGLWVAALAWCNRNDDRSDAREGIIPAFKLQSLLRVRNFKATITDLLDRQAMYEVEGGYRIHDYAEYQQTEKVKAIRDKRREAGRKGAAARWGSDNASDGNDIANAIANANGKLCPDPVPDPVPSTYSSRTTNHHQHGSTDDDADPRFAEVLTALVEARIAKWPTKANALAHRTSVTQSVLEQHGETIRQFLASKPDHPAGLCIKALAAREIA